MRRIRFLIVLVGLIVIGGILPMSASAQSSKFIWRPRLSDLERPKADSEPASSCGSDEHVGCSSSPIEVVVPVDIAKGQSYSESFDIGCANGTLKADAGWLRDAEQLWMGIRLPGSAENDIQWQRITANTFKYEQQLAFARAGRATVFIYNDGDTTVSVNRFGHTVGCTVQAAISNVWVDFGVDQDDQQGMLIHVKFSVENQQLAASSAIAYFYRDSGERIRDTNGAYHTQDGQVSVGQDFTPPYLGTSYSDLQLFIPYSELELNAGRNDLKFRVGLVDSYSNTFLAFSQDYSFWIE